MAGRGDTKSQPSYDTMTAAKIYVQRLMSETLRGIEDYLRTAGLL